MCLRLSPRARIPAVVIDGGLERERRRTARQPSELQTTKKTHGAACSLGDPAGGAPRNCRCRLPNWHDVGWHCTS